MQVLRGFDRLSKALVLVLAVAAALAPSAASADPTFGVMNATGGIYWRSAPDWNTAVQVSGFGFYPNTIIAVHCYQAGAANVPGSSDYMWEYATDVGGSGYGTGWINEHFINDGQPINQPSPGVPPCNPPPPPPPPASISASLGGVYGCASCHALNIAVHNFPTGTFTYYCHDNSGPGGGDTVFFSHAVSVTDPNQSTWPGVFCYDSGPYTAYLVMNGVTSNSVNFGPAPPPPTPASITASLGGQYGCSTCHALNIAVHNFATGTFTYYCHDNSGAGGSDTIFYSHAVSVTNPNQSSWPGVFCYDSGPYTAYLVMNGVTSNVVSFGPAPPPPTTTTSTPTTTNPPPPPGNLTYSIWNAAGGVYYRWAPHWSDTTSTPGVGVYNGDRVRLICGTLSDPVGPLGNTAWSYVTNLSRNVGNGWVSEHFINDGAAPDTLVAGESVCDQTVPGAPGSALNPVQPWPSNYAPPSLLGGDASHNCPGSPKSVFYEPKDQDAGAYAKIKPGDCNLPYTVWTSGKGDCSPNNAVPNTPSSVTTLAGWSLGRLGPVYELAGALPELSDQIMNVVLFDPGGADLGGDCDARFGPPTVSQVLAAWLNNSRSHHLLILAGRKSEQKPFDYWGYPYFHGLWDYYLKAMWGMPFADQALVCDYNNMDHGDVLATFAYVVKAVPSGCPAHKNPSPVGWHP